LTFHRLHHAGEYVTDGRIHVGLGEFQGRHGVFSSYDLDAGLDGCPNAVADWRVSLEHADTGAVDHNFDVYLVCAE
jgi:hypothetical protein